MKQMTTIRFEINGQMQKISIPETATLAEVIREQLKLTGTKISCNQGECGACTVLVNDVAVNSCLILASEVDGSSVTTIEGLAIGNELDVIQQAFIEEGAVQCGFCTPGMIMSTKGLLLNNTNPNDDEIVDALAGNICRCTGYDSIIKAVKTASISINRGTEDEC